MIRVTTRGLDKSLAGLSRLTNSVIPGAMTDSLNWTSYNLRERLQEEIKGVFDRPTRFTVDSIEVIKATPNRASATVRLKDYSSKAAPAAIWLAPQVYGGARSDKRSEKLLRDRGILPAGMHVAPGAGMKLDSMGNVGRGQMQKIISGLGASYDPYQRSTGSRRSTGNRQRFFVMTKGKRPMGIAERFGPRKGQVRIVLAFISKPSYQKRFDFYGIGAAFVNEDLPRTFDRAMERRLGSGRQLLAA